jgi:hypothetical protein
MKKQVSHITIFQSSKVISVLGAFTSAIFAFPLGILLILSGDSTRGLQAIVYPFILLLFMFIFYAIFFALYNFIAKYFGGLEIELKDVE